VRLAVSPSTIGCQPQYDRLSAPVRLAVSPSTIGCQPQYDWLSAPVRLTVSPSTIGCQPQCDWLSAPVRLAVSPSAMFTTFQKHGDICESNPFSLLLTEISCHFFTFIVISCYLFPFLAICCHLLPFLVISCHLLPFLVTSLSSQNAYFRKEVNYVSLFVPIPSPHTRSPTHDNYVITKTAPAVT
jgi:hypothetical protein